MYNDLYHPKFKKDIKKLDNSLIPKIKDHYIKIILENPYDFPQLTGLLAGIYSYHFKEKRVEYRICYTIDEKKNTIYFLMVGKRENIYNLLKRRL